MIDRPDRITVTEEYRDMVKRTNPVIQQLHIDENAELFERAVKQGYALEAFITTFMQSDAAFRLDMPLNRYRWEGTEGLWEDFLEECEAKDITLSKANPHEASAPNLMGEIAYWCGCVYREWHFRDGLWSEEMFEKLPPRILMDEYGWGHTMIVQTWLESNLDSLIADPTRGVEDSISHSPEK